MHIEFKEAYFFLTLPFIVIWLLFFIFSKKTRREQLVMSLLFLPIGPISELLYFKDYWVPQSILPLPIFIEDLIFIFCITGIAAVIYEVFISKKFKRISVPTHLAIPIIVVIVGGVSVLLWFLGINSIFATAVAFVIGAGFVVMHRKDLLLNSLISGIGVTAVMFISYFILFHIVIANTDEIFKQGWLLYGTKLDLRIYGIPFTEMVWGFCWGTLVGPLYEFVKKIG